MDGDRTKKVTTETSNDQVGRKEDLALTVAGSLALDQWAKRQLGPGQFGPNKSIPDLPNRLMFRPRMTLGRNEAFSGDRVPDGLW